MRVANILEKCAIKKRYLQALALCIIIFGLYLTTWNRSFAGYEPDTVEAAIALTKGTYLLKKPGIGSSLFYIPFVLGGKFLPQVQLLKFLSIVPVLYSAAIAGLIFLIADALNVKRSINLVGSFLIAGGSLLWPYSRIGMEFQETFLVCLLFLFLLNFQKKRFSPLIIGVVLMMLALTKSYGVLFVIPTLVMIFLGLEKGNKKTFFNPLFLLKLIGPTVLAGFFMVMVNVAFRGRISGAYGLSFEFFVINWWEGFWGTFFSAGKSIFLYSPLLIPSVFIFPRFYKQQPVASVFILVGFLLLLLITAPFRFWSDETLSVRKLVPIIPLLHLPLFMGLESMVRQRKKWLYIVAAVYCVLAIGVQVINTPYPYVRYLRFLRAGNMDTLMHIRYNPIASPMYINYSFFKSYISRKVFHQKSTTWAYSEATWMRCCLPPKVKDTLVIDYSADLSQYDIPSSFIITAENKIVRIVFSFTELIVILASSFCLVSTVYVASRNEKLNHSS